MFNEIGNIVIIGLEARRDRWDRCKEILQQNAISPVTHFTTKQDFQDTHRHYMKDFLRMLRLCTRGEYLCFFEDDFELIEGWEDILRQAWDEIPKDFDMLYLGANLTGEASFISKHLVRLRGAWLMHAVIMSRPFIQYILKTYDLNRIWIIDEFFRRIAPYKKFYMTYPMISFQRNGFSDAVGRYIYYDIYNNEFYKKLHEDYSTRTWLSATPERRSRVDVT